MPHYLLTGAGFSRNWGGWLADEAFEYLLGCPEINQDIHIALWRSKNQGLGFENTLEDLRATREKFKEDERFAKNVQVFELMLVSMFNTMTIGFKNTEFNPLHNPSLVGYQTDFVRRFLAHFDAIFTLNQDCLLELKYNIRDLHRISDGRWRDMYSPGVDPITLSGTPYEPPGLFKPGSKQYTLEHGRQPYFKLHGSCNWRDGDSTILIMGGNKGPDIEKTFLLRSYRDHFLGMIAKPNVKLVVVGYSFLDTHINEIIDHGIQKGAQIFIVDPKGIDVLDDAPNVKRTALELKDLWSGSIMGASRRWLRDIFSVDHVERAKIERFIVRLGPDG